MFLAVTRSCRRARGLEKETRLNILRKKIEYSVFSSQPSCSEVLLNYPIFDEFVLLPVCVEFSSFEILQRENHQALVVKATNCGRFGPACHFDLFAPFEKKCRFENCTLLLTSAFISVIYL